MSNAGSFTRLPAAARLLALGSLLYWTALSGVWALVGVWGTRYLGLPSSVVGAGLAVSAVIAAVVAIGGGALVDRLDRRLVLAGLRAWLAAGCLVLALAVAVLPGAAAFWLLCAILAGNGLGQAVEQSLVAAYVPEEQWSGAYALMSAAQYAGGFAGALGGALLLSWSRIGWLVVAAVVAASAAAVGALLPRIVVAADARPGLPTALKVLGDRRFLGFWLLGCVSVTLYFAFEVVAPVTLVSGHGLAPWSWGVLIGTVPVLLIGAELLIARVGGRWPWRWALAGSLLVLAIPFALLSMRPTAVTLVVIGLTFVAGEALWGPFAQTALAEMAGGATSAFAAYRLTFSIGLVVAPAAGLALRDAIGDRALWLALAGLSAVAGVVTALAYRRTGAERKAADQEGAGAFPVSS
ncbi:MFS transporter [Dactylosporangium vinaceum]|uniref:MFS transporter n=1 Tax=Dactylosporangium vinaceum TaxID=53362 RepID=A0ABV5MD39_9ACTN|nr:MFS transporter [Dactylosporangium vinaceum]UAC00825.1 MFS transporter [Dactylosporangium vinaceum]